MQITKFKIKHMEGSNIRLQQYTDWLEYTPTTVLMT